MTPSGNAQLDRVLFELDLPIFRRRNNENHERDVLRPDAHSFGVEPLTNAHSFGASLSTMSLFRRRFYAPLSQTCTAGACARSCKSRRAPRPRKLDGKLSRHGLGARRVALLAPRGDFNRYRHPLDYVGAITKILVKFKSKSRILGDENSIPSGGGKPEGKEGEFLLTPETNSLIECLRSRRTLRASTRETNSLFEACLNTMNSLKERPGSDAPFERAS